ncbi:alanine racemase [Ruficoccus sp. ZRK36]|uniref:alanine racemase n=1 Tax=Ruficoccus sp. ZRK36 TaxID=2866311 RepID=UPI001C73268D|nr:alanine racemase [Ruficoccus sp. ZRK36]QYY34458.1 alanine racemase [Ruficoccus sp. ZRK36]
MKAYRCWAEIDLGALERNLGRIRAALPPHMQYVAVVKADAYGHGMPRMVARLMQSGASMFAVANVYEGAELREVGRGWPILVLGPILPEEERYLAEYDLTATISTPEEVDRLSAAAARANTILPVHLKIDTGMGRLGVWHEDAASLYEKVMAAAGLKLAGIFTHFSSADTDPAFTSEQRNRFLHALETLPDLDTSKLLIHADNSAGLESLSPDSPFNAVRIGLLQFGCLPYPDSFLAELKPEPVLSFHTRVGITKSLPAGTSISYGQTFQLTRDSRLGVLTAGYGDGIPTTASNRAQVIIRGHRCPVLGRVTMDQTIVDLTDCPEAQAGDRVTLIGHQGDECIEVQEFSQWAMCIPWEAFCSITKRVPRLYRTSREQ